MIKDIILDDYTISISQLPSPLLVKLKLRWVKNVNECYKNQQQSLTERNDKIHTFETIRKAFDHSEVLSDCNSEASFLKLSENASKQITNIHDIDLFQAIQNQIYALQQKSALKLNQLQKSLALLESDSKRRKIQVEKDLMEQNKENLCVSFQRVVNPRQENDNMLQCKFEMDENFNYVKSKEYVQSEPFGSSQVKSKDIYSLQNSRQVTFQKIQNEQEGVTKRQPRVRSFSLSYRPHEVDNNQTTRKSSSGKNNLQKKKNKENRSSSSEKVAKRGRVYEQILSLYSIPKLLAMELKMK